jgi:hypothetical protein
MMLRAHTNITYGRGGITRHKNYLIIELLLLLRSVHAEESIRRAKK